MHFLLRETVLIVRNLPRLFHRLEPFKEFFLVLLDIFRRQHFLREFLLLGGTHSEEFPHRHPLDKVHLAHIWRARHIVLYRLLAFLLIFRRLQFLDKFSEHDVNVKFQIINFKTSFLQFDIYFKICILYFEIILSSSVE